MDIVKTATDWTRAEMLSSSFFILFGLSFLLASFGFWQLGRTDIARAYVVPMLVAGTLILIHRARPVLSEPGTADELPGGLRH
ncbi:hypothetical protein [Puniceibacterium confluentis]|uniref:hypothetical protein n=1 Tax=Puniceibacterium confluentis TaxID=1958944 RepID=UPI001C954108|nr:hypothetical protein [Puniceibacterium confluentis]